MFKMWVKLIDEQNHLLQDVVISDDSQDTRTHKVFGAVASACREFNLGTPIWLDCSKRDFQQFSKVRFYQDNFIDKIDFDYMEVQMLEED